MQRQQVAPNMLDYDDSVAAFSWFQARQSLNGLPDGHGLNIAYEAVDRHATGTLRDHVAIRWRGRQGERRSITYSELAELSSRFANVLASNGVQAGNKVFTLCPRIPELYVTALGDPEEPQCVLSAVSAFGPEPIRERLERGEASVVVTTESLYRRKLAPIRNEVPTLRLVLIVTDGAAALPEGTADLHSLLEAADPEFKIAPTRPDDPALLHFTSGTTGRAKGAVHVHEAVVAHHATAHYALDFHPDDVFWCTADPGWVTGTSYGIIAPLTHGLTSVIEEAEFDAAVWYQLLQDERVSVWYTAPTAIRLLMRAGAALATQYDLSSLRLVASVGEPLEPDAVTWAQETWRAPVLDNWWQTETGGIMISNYLSMEAPSGLDGAPATRHRGGVGGEQ